MTRKHEAEMLAKQAFNAAAIVINGAPDMGIALAACSMVKSYFEAEISSSLFTQKRSLKDVILNSD